MASSYLKSIVLDNKELMLDSSIASRNELLKQFFTIPGSAETLLDNLRIVPLAPNQVLYEHGDKIDFVYFPLDSVISALAIMEDGTSIETAMVGREALVGISAVLGSGRSRQWHWVTIGGEAIQLEAKVFERLFLRSDTALKAMLECYRGLITQVSQRCVCNTRHTIMERLCCWLLMIHDRVGGNKLNLTQEMIAARVGARRAGITVAAGMLQDMHAIEYRRGLLHINSRSQLEQAVCECYAMMQVDKGEGEDLFPIARLAHCR